jgi:adenosylhomocysteine nucleosidase
LSARSAGLKRKLMSSVEARVVVAAAMERELAGLRRPGARRLVFICTGEGRENVRRVLSSRLEQEKAAAVVVIGFAGALSHSLRAGDIVVAATVRDARGNAISAGDTDLLKGAAQVKVEGSRIYFGATVTADEIICRSKEKRRLATLLAEDETGCVDMESSAVAEVCDLHGIPFLIVRAVTDLLDEDLPIDFNRCRDADGRVSNRKVIRSALLRPHAIGGLWRLRRHSQLCAERLSLFVEQLISTIQ